MKFLKVFLMVTGTFSLIIACGNGGGGGGGTTSTGISYTGSTSQATLTQNNSQDITTGAYQGGQTGVAAVSLGGVQSVEENKITRPRPFMVYQGLERALHEIDIASHSGGGSSGIVTNDSDRINGDCGGYADYTIKYDTPHNLDPFKFGTNLFI